MANGLNFINKEGYWVSSLNYWQLAIYQLWEWKVDLEEGGGSREVAKPIFVTMENACIFWRVMDALSSVTLLWKDK
jgi:hypothetical protein